MNLRKKLLLTMPTAIVGIGLIQAPAAIAQDAPAPLPPELTRIQKDVEAAAQNAAIDFLKTNPNIKVDNTDINIKDVNNGVENNISVPLPLDQNARNQIDATNVIPGVTFHSQQRTEEFTAEHEETQNVVERLDPNMEQGEVHVENEGAPQQAAAITRTTTVNGGEPEEKTYSQPIKPGTDRVVVAGAKPKRMTITVAPQPQSAPAAAPAQAPRAAAAAPAVANGSVWDRLAQCESSGNWAINTGNGYHGGLQFSPTTWNAYKRGTSAEGVAFAYQASREQQIEVAQKVQAGQGWGAWPACTAKLGIR